MHKTLLFHSFHIRPNYSPFFSVAAWAWSFSVIITLFLHSFNSLHPTHVQPTHPGLSPCRHSAHNCRTVGHWHIDLRHGEQKQNTLFCFFFPLPHLHCARSLTVLKQFNSNDAKMNSCSSGCLRHVFVSSFILFSSFFLPFSPSLWTVSSRANSFFSWCTSHLHTYQSVWTIQQRL